MHKWSVCKGERYKNKAKKKEEECKMIKTLELKMFDQTHTARKPLEVTPPGSDAMVPSAAAACCF